MPKDKRDLRSPEKNVHMGCGSGITLTICPSDLTGTYGTQERRNPPSRRLGILGGISPESTMIYYRYIIREHHTQHGNPEYPEIVILSVDYQDYATCLLQGRWDALLVKITQALKSLQRAGADYGLIACNTLHIAFDEIQKRSPMPLISIVEATSESIEQKGIKTVGLLGTALTVNSGVYERNLEERGIVTLVPPAQDVRFVDKVIRNELVLGVIRGKSKRRFIRITNRLASSGAEGIVLGCTEIPLLLSEKDCRIQLFDTALIHVQKALAYSRVTHQNESPFSTNLVH